VTEQDWLRRARAGDEEAFAKLVETYQTAIYNLCYRMLGEPNEAEDAAQEAFLRAYSQLSTYDPARSFKTWLFSIASHYCIDRLRKRRLTWLSLEEDELPPHPALQEPNPGPEEVAVRRQQTAAIQALLSKLPPEDRSVIVMRYWYDRECGKKPSAPCTRRHGRDDEVCSGRPKSFPSGSVPDSPGGGVEDES
jgi:RNA polymerase sigma-70 factor (ECF subfamily)